MTSNLTRGRALGEKMWPFLLNSRFILDVKMKLFTPIVVKLFSSCTARCPPVPTLSAPVSQGNDLWKPLD